MLRIRPYITLDNKIDGASVILLDIDSFLRKDQKAQTEAESARLRKKCIARVKRQGTAMLTRDIIVLGTSTGGVEALLRIVRDLPADLPAAVFVVCHVGATRKSSLPEILDRSGPLPAAHAWDGEPIRPGRVYVAPPDHHMVLTADAVRLTHGPRENRHRPAVDPLFRTAARVFGPRVAGVVLTGALGDGAAGLMAVRAAGGAAIVQDPSDAMMSDMPQTALIVAGADYVVPLAEIAPLLVQLSGQTEEGGGSRTMPDPLEVSSRKVELDMAAQQNGRRAGDLTVFTCPECGGSMWQMNEKELTRFRCHTGHLYYGENLLEEQSSALEAALWTAVRTFKERTILARQLAEREREHGRPDAAKHFEDEAELSKKYGDLIIRHVLHAEGAQAGGPADVPAPPETGISRCRLAATGQRGA